LSLVSVVRCKVEVSASGRSLVQRSPTERGVSECDGEASTKKWPLPNRGCRAMGEKKFALIVESKHMGQMINQSLFPTYISTPRFLVEIG
jgi:hypothetical protein